MKKFLPIFLIVVFVVGILIAVYSSQIALNTIEKKLQEDEILEWHEVARVRLVDIVGEQPYSVGVTQWMSTFILDYGEVPETVLANNATDWENSATAIGYVDTDNTETDLKSEDPGYFVVRVKHNDTAKDGASWNWSRFRVKLNVTGDETVDDVYAYDNASGGTDATVSAQTADEIWINYFWDDDVDGYRITDDGSLDWAIVIEERY